MSDFFNYYSFLGIAKNASTEEIETAINNMSNRYKNTSVDNQDIINRIAKSREVLLNKATRSRYDSEYAERERKLRIINAYVEDTEIIQPSSTTSPISDNEDFLSYYRAIKDARKPIPNENYYLDPLPPRENTPKQSSKPKLQVSDSTIAKMTTSSPNRKWLLARKAIAGTMIVAIGLAGTLTAKPHSQAEPVEEKASYSAVMEPISEEEDKELLVQDSRAEKFSGKVVLSRIHRIVEGDTLSKFSIESNTLIEEIKLANVMSGDKLIIGRYIDIPYIIDEKDLKYYTEEIPYEENTTLTQIADEHETTRETLKRLNPDTITKDINGADIVMGDSIIIPNFITKEEYDTLKASDTNLAQNK